RQFHSVIDARYVGQNHEVAVAGDDLARDGLAAFLERFATAHAREYGYAIPGRAVEIVNCRLQARGQVPRPPLNRAASRHEQPPEIGRRRVHFGPHGWLDTPVLARARLAPGAEREGPAIINEMSSTTVVPPGDAFRIDEIGNILIEIRHEA
ncbi:MAG: hydantoinase/oxoprolinase family protein, partial [Hyphomicrobiaceae bacterium]